MQLINITAKQRAAATAARDALLPFYSSGAPDALIDEVSRINRVLLCFARADEIVDALFCAEEGHALSAEQLEQLRNAALLPIESIGLSQSRVVLALGAAAERVAA